MRNAPPRPKNLGGRSGNHTPAVVGMITGGEEFKEKRSPQGFKASLDPHEEGETEQNHIHQDNQEAERDRQFNRRREKGNFC